MGLGELLMAAWLLASGVLAIRWAVAALRLSRASRSWQPGTVDGTPVWRTEKLGPAVAGTFRPRVLVPGWLDTLPAGQRSLILLHEQEHIRARDPMLIVLARLARIAAPWNPAVWLLSSRLVRAVELDCDRRVLRRDADVATYGRTLLTVSERRPSRLVAVAAFAESEAPLRSRILAMTTPSKTISIVALLTSMVLGVVLLIGALEIPVPAVSIQIAVQPADDAQRADAEVDATQGLPPVQNRSGEVPPPPATREGARANAEPPSAEETIDRLRQESTSRRQGRTTEPIVGVTRPEGVTYGEPVFTPYTVPPSILNREQVVRAMADAYPALLRDAGIGGTVRVFFFIDETGTVRDRRIDQSSGHPALDDAALAVAGVYRFSAALNRDRPTPVWVSFPITFRVR
jgi:TonB family protein